MFWRRSLRFVAAGMSAAFMSAASSRTPSASSSASVGQARLRVLLLDALLGLLLLERQVGRAADDEDEEADRRAGQRQQERVVGAGARLGHGVEWEGIYIDSLSSHGRRAAARVVA